VRLHRTCCAVQVYGPYTCYFVRHSTYAADLDTWAQNTSLIQTNKTLDVKGTDLRTKLGCGWHSSRVGLGTATP
jgi:hypothetical protein